MKVLKNKWQESLNNFKKTSTEIEINIENFGEVKCMNRKMQEW